MNVENLELSTRQRAASASLQSVPVEATTSRNVPTVNVAGSRGRISTRRICGQPMAHPDHPPVEGEEQLFAGVRVYWDDAWDAIVLTVGPNRIVLEPDTMERFFVWLEKEDARKRINRRVLFCVACHEPFTTGAWQGQYCSSRCRNRMQKRRYRARKKGDTDDSSQ